MVIRTITAARLVNTGNYENTRFEAMGELREGEDPDKCMAALQELLADMARAERIRRYPELTERRWHRWLEEDGERDHAEDLASRVIVADVEV